MRGQEQKTTWWVVGGRWSHNRLLSNQHPKQADWTLSFKLTRTQLQLKRRKWLRGSTGEHEGAGESSEGAWGSNEGAHWRNGR